MTVVHGVVTNFDDARGDGTVRDGEGRDYYVHCVDIGDGSRTIAVGTAVAFVPQVGHLGRVEASDVQSVAS